MKYTLASSKLVNGSGGYMPFNRQKDIELLYVRSKCLKAELEKICSFASLKSTKVVARLGENIVCQCAILNSLQLIRDIVNHISPNLGHLQSEARSIHYIDPDSIEAIREEGHEGESAFKHYFFLFLHSNINFPLLRLWILSRFPF